MRQRSGFLSDEAISQKCRAFRPIPQKRAEQVLYKPPVWNLTYQLKLPKHEKMTNRPVNFQALAQALSKTYQPHNKRQFQAQLDAQFTSDMNSDDPTDLHIGTMGRADFESTLAGMPPQPVWGGLPKEKNRDPDVAQVLHDALQRQAIQEHQAQRDQQIQSLMHKNLGEMRRMYDVIYHNMSTDMRQTFKSPNSFYGGGENRGRMADELLTAMQTYGMAQSQQLIDSAFAQAAANVAPAPAPAAPVPLPAPGQ
jgi:hypothetical protein